MVLRLGRSPKHDAQEHVTKKSRDEGYVPENIP